MSEGDVLNLKRRALQAKKAGDLDEARRLLAEANSLAASQPTTATDFKRLALELKRKGDIDGAREALSKAKKIEATQQQAAGEPSSPAVASPTPTRIHEEDPVNKAMDEATLDEITGPSNIEFTDEEMLDVDTMADMASTGMDIPTEEVYNARALAWKKAALEAKNKGDIATAKKLLGKAKEFEAAVETLFRADDGALDMMDDDDEDYSLLDELAGINEAVSQDDDEFRDLFGSTTNNNAVELDDLDDLDPSMLRDMMESGMEIPNVDEIRSTAQQKKALAIEFKKQGNIIAAKGALEESKRLEGRATQLSDMLRSIESGACDDQNLDPEAMFEMMMKADGAAPKSKPPAPVSAPAPVKKEPLKSSHEYKIDAVRLKKENKMAEATAMLRLYKEALAAESSAASAQKKKDCVTKLQSEIDLAKKQLALYRFYESFVDESIGRKQNTFWKGYHRSCVAALESAQNGELPDLKRSAELGAMELVASDLSFIAEATDETDPRIEFALMDAIGLLDNKHMKRIIEDPKRAKSKNTNPTLIRVVITVQLPPNPDQPDDFVERTFEVETSADGFCTFQESSFFVDAARGTSRFAKLLARRLQRRRVTFDVYHVEEKKGLLSRSSNITLLGTAVLELKDLLASRYIAGEFPLLDVTRRHESGGHLRVAARTGAPFTDDAEKKSEIEAKTGVSQNGTALKPFPAFSLS